MSTRLSQEMADLMDTKLISTGEDYWDDWATWIFVTCTVLLIAEVVELLWHAYRDATDRGRRPLLRKRAICLFLCLAFVSLFVVNAVKLGYQRSKLAVWGEIEARYRLFEDVGNFTRIRGIVRSRLRNSSLRRLKSFSPDEYLNPDAFWERILQRVTERVDVASQRRALGEGVPASWATALERGYYEFTWTAQLDNVWDNFRMLVVTSRRFWWTQQWFTAYTAWALFVGVECHHREIRKTAVVAFPLLGYVFGLSGVQCLFFVLLLLKPKVPRQATCMPQGCRTLLNFGMETFAVFMLRASLNLVSTTRDGILHSLLQTCVVVLPLLSQLEMALWPRTYMRHQGTACMAKRSLYWVYFIMAVPLAGAMHIISTMKALEETGWTKWFQRTSGLPWKDAGPNHASGFTGTVGALLDSIGDHDCTSAIGLDVLFSALALCCWAVIGSLDARSILKCGMCPWIDEGVEAKRAARSAQSAARDLSRRRSIARAVEGYELEDETRDTSARGRSFDDELDTAGSRHEAVGRTSRSRTRSRRGSMSSMKRELSRLRRRSLSRGWDGSSGSGYDGGSGGYDAESRRMFKRRAGPAEAAAVAWGLFTLGGVGVASTAVFGAGELE